MKKNIKSNAQIIGILIITCVLSACANHVKYEYEIDKKERRKALPTEYKLVPGASSNNSLNVQATAVVPYEVDVYGTKNKIESFVPYKAGREFIEIPSGLLSTVLIVPPFLPDYWAMINPFMNAEVGWTEGVKFRKESRVVEQTPYSEPIKKEEITAGVPKQSVWFRVPGGDAVKVSTDDKGQAQIGLIDLISGPQASKAGYIEVAMKVPPDGDNWIQEKINLSPGKRTELQKITPSVQHVRSPSSSIQLRDAAIFLNKAGYAAWVEQNLSTAFKRLGKLHHCNIDVKGWIPVRGSCRDGKLDGDLSLIAIDGGGRLDGFANTGALVKGKRILTSGQGYEGEWRNGVPHGKGKDIWHHQVSYEGDFSDGRRDGQGTCLYEGQYERCEYRQGSRIDSLHVTRVELQKHQKKIEQIQREQEKRHQEELRLAEQQRQAELRRQQEEARRQAEVAAQQKKKPGFQWGKALALGAGALAGGAADLPDSVQQDLVSGIIADSASGQQGISNFQGGLNTPSNSGNAAASSSSSGRVAASGKLPKSRQISFTCPSGASFNAPAYARTDACLNAMEEFARVMACNEVSRMRQVQSQCQSVCGSPNCTQR